MESLQPGDPRRVGGYAVLGRLGAGGMGLVLLGRSRGGRLVALKVVHAALASDPRFRSRFRHEVVAAQAVSGAFTAPVIDADPDAELPWLVTAFLPGMTLQDAVAAHGVLPTPSLRALGAGLTEALISIHRAGVVHRDLKPSNVMLTPQGPRVIDFGIARAAEVSAMTRSGTLLGSPAYMSPEQAAGAQVGPAGDVFSLGGVLAYAATGQPPFGLAQIHTLVYRVLHEPPRLDGLTDPELRAIVAACLDKDPGRRPSPRDLLRRLAAPGAGLGSAAWLPPPVAAAVTRRQDGLPRAGIGRRRLLVLGAAGAAALGAGGTAVLLPRLRRTGPPWTCRPATTVSKGPVVTSGSLYVGDSESFYAIDTHSGKTRWNSPLVYGSLDFSPTMRDGIGYLTGGSGLVAFDPGTGRSLWQHAGSPNALAAHPELAMGSGLVYLAAGAATSATGYALRAYDARTGDTRWDYHVASPLRCNAAVSAGLVFVGGQDGFLHAIDAASGGLRWKQDLGSAVRSTPVPTGGAVLVTTENFGVAALESATGRIRWRAQAGEGSNYYGAPPIPAGDVILVNPDHILYAFGIADGRLRWKRDFPKVTGGPVPANGLVIVNAGSTLYAVDAATGKVRWAGRNSEEFTEQPVLARGAVHMITYHGVQSFAQASGRLLHHTGQLSLAKGLTTDGSTLYFTTDSSEVRALPAPH